MSPETSSPSIDQPAANEPTQPRPSNLVRWLQNLGKLTIYGQLLYASALIAGLIVVFGIYAIIMHAAYLGYPSIFVGILLISTVARFALNRDKKS